MLEERNKEYKSIKFVDISSEDYSPEENQGLDYKIVIVSNMIIFVYKRLVKGYDCLLLYCVCRSWEEFMQLLLMEL